MYVNTKFFFSQKYVTLNEKASIFKMYKKLFGLVTMG